MTTSDSQGACAGPPFVACPGPDCEVTIHNDDRPPRRMHRQFIRPPVFGRGAVTGDQPPEAAPLIAPVEPPRPVNRASIHLHLHREGGELAPGQGPEAGRELPPPRPPSPDNNAPPPNARDDNEPFFRVRCC